MLLLEVDLGDEGVIGWMELVGADLIEDAVEVGFEIIGHAECLLCIEESVSRVMLIVEIYLTRFFGGRNYMVRISRHPPTIPPFRWVY